jgi:hypothetical protein
VLSRVVVAQGAGVGGREAITHHDAAKGGSQQLHRRGGRTAQTLRKDREHRRHQHPQPAATTLCVAPVGIPGGGTGFIHVDHGLQPGFPQGFLHRFTQAGRQPRGNRHDCSAADRHPEQPLLQTHQGTEAGPVVTGLHPLGQLSAGASGATGTEQAVQAVFDHLRLDRRDVDHLMAVGRRIHSRQWVAAAPTSDRQMVMGALAALHRQQPRPRAWMAWLATPLAANAFAFQGRLESLAVAGGWFGRVARVAADALPKAGQLGSQCGELLTHLLIFLPQHQELLPLHPYLLLLSQDERPYISRLRQPAGF